MKKSTFLFSLFFAVAVDAFSQQHLIDSLTLINKTYKIEDTVKLNIWNELSFAYFNVEPKIGIAYADSAVQLSEKLNLADKKAQSLNNKGVNYWALGEDQKALEIYREVLDFHTENANQRRIATTLNNLALIEYNQGDYRNAIVHHEEATAIFESLGMRKNVINSLSNSGVVMLALADYPKALQYFLNADKKTIDEDSLEKANISMNLGLIYKNLQELPLAQEHYEKSKEIYLALGNATGLSNVHSNLGNMYHIRGEYDRAMQHFEEAILINQRIGNKRKEASDYINLARLQRELQNYEDAEKNIHLSKDIYSSLNDTYNLSHVLLEEAENLHSMAKYRKISPDYNKILKLRKAALLFAQTNGSKLRLQESHLAISETEEAMGRYGNSLSHYKLYIQYRDSIGSEDIKKDIIQQRLAFDAEKKEALLTQGFEMEKDILRAEKLNEQYAKTSLGIVLLLLLSSGTVFFWLYKKKTAAEEKQKKADFHSRLKEVELKALRAQMNPHFIFNSLNSISNYMLKHQMDEAEAYLQDFSGLIRLILDYSQKTEVSLNEEIYLLEGYVRLESKRIKKNISLITDIAEDIDPEHCMVPPLIFQPLVENSIWHGISNTPSEGKIIIRISKTRQDLLECLIEDNGKQASVKIASNHRSRGLDIVRERVSLLVNHMEWEDIFSTSSHPDGFAVKFILPNQQRF